MTKKQGNDAKSEEKTPKTPKNDVAWGRVFKALPIDDEIQSNGHYDISSDQLKDLGGREARLMTKIDFKENLPSQFVERGLAILAISNGVYRIAKFNPFISIKPKAASKSIYVPPTNLISLKPELLSGESAFLDIALASGIMEQVFGEKVQLTIRGRQYCPKIDFHLNNISFPVKGVQIEVDGGYEGDSTINLVEAKIGGRENLSLRQILYPQKSWEGVVAGAKAVRSFILFYQDPTLRFIPIVENQGTWTPDHANEKCFRFERLATFDIRSVPVQPSATPPVYGAPFPQADRFETVLAILFMLYCGEEYSMETEDLTSKLGGFGFRLVPRQISYYCAALVWLGLAKRERGSIKLTSFGIEVATMSHAERMEALAKVIFREPLFHHVLHKPATSPPETLFKRWNFDGSTKGRRIQTINSWIKHFQEKIEEE